MTTRAAMEAWAAGLFEGEGYVSVGRTSGGRPKVRVAIGMTDPDVLEKFAEVVGGKVKGPYDRGRLKDIYRWDAYGFAEVRRIFGMFEPYLGARRSSRFREVLAMEPDPDDLPGHAGRDRTHCKRGHPLSGDNLYVRPDRGHRECRACRSASSRNDEPVREAVA